MGPNPHSTQVTVPADAVLGAFAGTGAVWLMDRVGWWMYRREDPAALERELQARPDGLDGAHLLARKLGRAIGRDPGRQQPNAAGLAVHYALGALPGLGYALMSRRFPVNAGAGLPFGLALFVVNDEISAPLLGLAHGPRAYPAQSHLRGLVAHLVLGVATDRLLAVGRRVWASPVGSAQRQRRPRNSPRRLPSGPATAVAVPGVRA